MGGGGGRNGGRIEILHQKQKSIGAYGGGGVHPPGPAAGSDIV